MVKIDDNVLAWVVSAMAASIAEIKIQRQPQITALTQQKQWLKGRLEKMYMDKLDGVIGDEEYMRLSKKFGRNLNDLKFSMEQL